jgi:hypothetical protein
MRQVAKSNSGIQKIFDAIQGSMTGLSLKHALSQGARPLPLARTIYGDT